MQGPRSTELPEVLESSQICQVLDLSKSVINYLVSMPLQAFELLG